MAGLTRDQVLAAIMSVDGAISAEEAFVLFEEAQKVRDGCIVEIGSHRGRSTAALALGSRAAYGVPVYAIEPHDDFRGILGGAFGADERARFMRNMLALDLTETVHLVNLSSEFVTAGAWPHPVGLLWVDGDHRYAAVKRDIACWLPHLRPDATVLLHDAVDRQIGPIHVAEQMLATDEWQCGVRVGDLLALHRRRPALRRTLSWFKWPRRRRPAPARPA